MGLFKKSYHCVKRIKFYEIQINYYVWQKSITDVAVITKWDYLLEIVIDITKYEKKLLQSVIGITKCDNYITNSHITRYLYLGYAF